MATLSPSATVAAPCFPLLSSLTPDALRSVLCRVPARDHNSLRRTCRGVRDVVDSEIFRKERCLSGWAETKVSLPTREKLVQKARKEEQEQRERSRIYRRRMRKSGKRAVNNEECTGGESETDSRPSGESSASEEEDVDDDIEEWYGNIGFLDQSYGYQDATLTVWVDGKSGGSVKIVLVPRRGDQCFHEATDAHSRDLQFVGWNYCDARGRLRLQSIKAEGGTACNRGGLLYIKKFVLKPEYGSGVATTNVAAGAVRAIMTHSRLARKWTLAVYLSDSEVQHSPEDERLSKRIEAFNCGSLGYQGTSAEPTKEERQAHERRISELAVLDMRTFLRAGFRQVPEMVRHKGNHFHCFAIPSFFGPEGAADSSLGDGSTHEEIEMMTHEEALAIPVLHPPLFPTSPVGVDMELLDMVKNSCCERGCLKEYVRPTEVQEMLDTIAAQDQEATETMETILSEKLQLIDGPQWEEIERVIRQEMQPEMQAIYQKINEIRTQRKEIERQQATHQKIYESGQAMQQKLKEMRTTIETKEEEFRAEHRAALDRIKDRVRNESSRLVREKGASIEASNVLHCAATYLLQDYVLLFADLVPPAERAKAMNALDNNGVTPLMCATGSIMASENGAEKQHTVYEQLLSLGAEKNFVGPSDGLTALGHYRSRIQILQDQSRVFYPGSSNGDAPDWSDRIESLLMPANGPTPEDNALLDVGSDNESIQDDSHLESDLDEESDDGSAVDRDGESFAGSDAEEDMDASGEDGSGPIEDMDARVA